MPKNHSRTSWEALADKTAAFRGSLDKGTPATPAQARARLSSLISDKEWSRRYANGDVLAKKEFADLNALVAYGDSVADAVSGAAEPVPFEVVAPGELSTQNTMQAVADLRTHGMPDKAISEILNGAKFTPEQVTAAARWKEQALRDPGFCNLFMASDPQARNQMTVADAIIAAGVE
jgi:hypothetical protein